MAVKFAPARPVFLNFDPWQKRIIEADYFSRRRFLAKRVRPSYPRFHYKFKAVPVDENADLSHLRDLIVEGRFWLSSPRDFNDPFDMTARVILQGTTDELRERFKQLVDREGTKQGLNWKERRKRLNAFMARSRTDWLRSIKMIHERHTAAMGIFSFAGDPRSILMWSHYASNHTGVCLQFEIARDPRALLEAVPVKYTDNCPLFNWAKDTGDAIKATMLNKLVAWSYEKEWRIPWPDGARSYLQFDPNALIGIIFGCRAGDATVRVIDTLLVERASRGL